MSLAQRLAQVRARIEAAALRAQREPREVTLIAVTKGHPHRTVAQARAAGCGDVGENYPQEMLEKMDAEPGPDLRWHLIGPLQRNKARHVVGRVSLIHTVDSARLALELEKRAAAKDITVEVLCQVNVAGELQKHGVAPADAGSLLETIAEQKHLRARGLMTIGPMAEEAERSRPHFRALRELRDRLQRAGHDNDLEELSMGMSHDFEVAIEEGATMVRIGTALFGERPPRARAGTQAGETT